MASTETPQTIIQISFTAGGAESGPGGPEYGDAEHIGGGEAGRGYVRFVRAGLCSESRGLESDTA